MVICLERGTDLHMAQLMPLPLTFSCFSKIQIGFTFLVLADPGSPAQRAVKRVCWCCCWGLVMIVITMRVVDDYKWYIFWDTFSRSNTCRLSGVYQIVSSSQHLTGFVFGWLMRCWCGYMPGARCRLFAYRPADATAIPTCNLASLKCSLFCLCGISFPRFSW